MIAPLHDGVAFETIHGADDTAVPLTACAYVTWKCRSCPTPTGDIVCPGMPTDEGRLGIMSSSLPRRNQPWSERTPCRRPWKCSRNEVTHFRSHCSPGRPGQPTLGVEVRPPRPSRRMPWETRLRPVTVRYTTGVDCRRQVAQAQEEAALPKRTTSLSASASTGPTDAPTTTATTATATTPHAEGEGAPRRGNKRGAVADDVGATAPKSCTTPRGRSASRTPPPAKSIAEWNAPLSIPLRERLGLGPPCAVLAIVPPPSTGSPSCLRGKCGGSVPPPRAQFAPAFTSARRRAASPNSIPKPCSPSRRCAWRAAAKGSIEQRPTAVAEGTRRAPQPPDPEASA